MNARPLIFLPVILSLSLVLAACGTPSTPPTQFSGPSAPDDQPGGAPPQPVFSGDIDEIIFYTRPNYIDPEIYALFQESHGVEVTEDNYSSNQDMLARLQGLGATESYALVVPSGYMAASMIQAGMLAELDQNKIPNLGNLSDEFRNLPFDPGNRYCVPYQWGTTGIGYNSALVEQPTSWSAIFESTPNLSGYGRITMLDDARESFATALIYLGYDINTTNVSELEAAKSLLVQARAGIASFDSDNFDELIASGENVLAHGWNRDFLIAMEANEDLRFTIPQEGGVIWVDNLCIPNTASPAKKEAAEVFINFLLEPEIGAQLSEFNRFASPNAASEAYLLDEFLVDPTVYPPREIFDRLQLIEPVGEFEAVYQQLWDEIKSAPVP